jgi:hypothetical protein
MKTVDLWLSMSLLCGVTGYAQKTTPPAPPPPRTACTLVTVAEVMRATGAANVEIDKAGSGEDPGSGLSGCTWRIKGGTRALVEMTIENAQMPTAVEQVTGTPAGGDRVGSAFSLRKLQAFSGGPEPAPVAGLGDEAFYRDFTGAKGGALLMRQGAEIVTMSGSVGKDAYVALARLVSGRLKHP